MSDSVYKHIASILTELRSDVLARADHRVVALWLKKYLEALPHRELRSINALMYAGRDRDPARRIEQYIERCNIFSNEELVDGMVIRLDSLQEYLNRGMTLAQSNTVQS
jgi:hypothetical protein